MARAENQALSSRLEVCEKERSQLALDVILAKTEAKQNYGYFARWKKVRGDLELAEQKHKELEGDGRLREEQHQAKLVRLADGAREDYAKIKRLKAEVKVLTTKGSGDTATSSDQVIRTQQPIHVSTGMAQKTPGSAIKPSDPRADAQKDHDGRRADAWEGRQGVTAATIRKFRTVPLVDWGTTSSGVKADKGKGRAI